MNRLFVSILHLSTLRLIAQLIALMSGLLISTLLGADTSTDHYYAALILPPALANLAVNILTNVFTPVYLNYIHRDPSQQGPILISMVSLLTTGLGLGALISVLAVPVSIPLRGLQTSEATTQAYIFGFALIVLTPLVGYSRLIGIVCEAHELYLVPAAVALLNPVVFVTTLLLTIPQIGIYALICANIVGHLSELIVLVLYARHRFPITFRLRFEMHPAVREMLMFAPTVTYIALFFLPTFNRTAAAALDSGSLSAFHYGERLIHVIDLLIVGGILTVISNHWATLAARDGIEAAARTLNNLTSRIIFILVPLSVGGFLLSKPIISVAFERGAFTAVESSAEVFGIFLLSVPLNVLIVLNVRLLLIAKAIRDQMILALGITGLNTLLNFALVPFFGLAGIALSTLLSRALILLLSYLFLRKHLPQIRLKPLLVPLSRTLISAGGMLIVLLLLETYLSPALARSEGFMAQIGALGVLSGAGGIVYFLIAFLIRHPDLPLLLQVTRPAARITEA